MVGNAFLGAALGTLARILSHDILPFQIIFLANLCGLVWLAPWLCRSGFSATRTRRLPLYMARSLLELTGWFCVFHAVTLVPLPVFTSLSFMNPLLLSLLATMLLKEQTSYHSWLALFGGITGVLIVLRPDFTGYYEGALYMVISAICFSCCGLIIKKMLSTEPPFRILFYMLLFTGIFALPPAATEWNPVSPDILYLVVLLGTAQALQQYSVPRAFTKAPLTIIMPFAFMGLIFSAILAYIFFDEIITLWTIAGSIVILGSSFYALRHSMRKQRAS